MQIKTIGVVIPIYNVEKYLKECLDSVINQTYTNLEIILVNDGSTDENSFNIAKEYTLKDKRITLFDKKNGGLSSARNVGIEYFSGEYKLKNKTQTIKENSLIEFNIEGNNPYEIYTIYKSYKAFNDEKDLISFTYPSIDYIIFLDSDDYWELNCIEECVLRMDGVDVLWFDHYFYYDGVCSPNTPSETLMQKCKFIRNQKISSCDFLEVLLDIKRRNFWFGWHGMIDFGYLKSIGLKFLNQVLHEDHYFGKLLFLQSNNIFIFTKKCLYYRIRVGSIMNRGKGIVYVPEYMLKDFSILDKSLILYKYYHKKASLFLTAMMIFKFIKEKDINNKELFKSVFFSKLKIWRNDLLNFESKYMQKVLYLTFCRFFILSKDINVNLALISDFFSEEIISKNKSIEDKVKQIQKTNQDLNQIQNKLSFQTKYGTAKIRIQNQLSYRLGQVMIINSKSLLGYLIMPVALLSIMISHKQEQKIYQEKIKKAPSLKLPPLESYPDYQEALKEKECLTYKLGQALIQANKTWYKGGYVKLWFEIGKLKREYKNKKI
ncbi:glycosyltransferase family 2 protein [Campylobacter peloridis]|uniref:glycosyltransferase family 2 protein n=1 Tax=Campylobacter peloridis TaxID=488546 RepID=UPI001C736589|nr:glycosyltransferase family 2 protein [Campylobacter peloridis]MBX1886585.1 glycosyltransferase family 2 protein [Campylobacter peloridis]